MGKRPISKTVFVPAAVLPGGEPCPEILTADEAVRYLRLDETNTKDPIGTLKFYRMKGQLMCCKIGTQLLYRRDALDDFAKKREGF